MLSKDKRFLKVDFETLFFFPKVIPIKFGKVYIKRQDLSTHKIAVMCTKTVKGSVKRNYTKRIVKNTLSCIMDEKGFCGLVGVVVNQSLKDKPKEDVYFTLEKCLHKILN